MLYGNEGGWAYAFYDLVHPGTRAAFIAREVECAAVEGPRTKMVCLLRDAELTAKKSKAIKRLLILSGALVAASIGGGAYFIKRRLSSKKAATKAPSAIAGW